MSEESLNVLKRNFLLIFGRQLITFFINILSSIILARYLGTEGFGNYTLIFVYTTFVSSLMTLGINTSNVYFLAKKEIKETIIFNSYVYVFVTFVLLSPFIYLLLESFVSFSNQEILISIILILLLFSNLIFSSFFQGLQDFKSMNLILLIGSISLIIFQLVLLPFSPDEYDFLYVLMLSHLIQIIFVLIRFKKMKFTFKFFDITVLKKQLKFGVQNYLSNILTLVNYRGDTIIMERFLSAQHIGLYNVGVNLVEKLWVITSTLTTALYPKLTEISSDKLQSRLIVVSLSKIILVFNFLGCVIFLIFGNQIIRLLYGEEFVEAAMVINILLPGIMAMSISKVMANYISSIGKPILNFYVSILVVSLNVILNIILIPEYGVLGAAITTTFVYSLNFLFKSFFFYRLSSLQVNEIVWNTIDQVIYKQIRRKFIR